MNRIPNIRRSVFLTIKLSIKTTARAMQRGYFCFSKYSASFFNPAINDLIL
jgi:hypothetical protein